MSLEDDSTTQLQTMEDPAAVDGSEGFSQAPRFAGEEPVPLRDPATAELQRERADRVRAVVGPGRPIALPSPSRRSLAGALLALAAVVGLIVVSVSSGGGSDPVSPAPARTASATVHRTGTDATPIRPKITPAPPRSHVRRHPAPTAAESGAGRRRARHAHELRPGSRHHKVRHRHRRAQRDASPAADDGGHPAPAAPASTTTATTSEAEPVAVESVTPEPTPEPPPAPEVAPPEPTSSETGGAPAEPTPAPTTAEDEFGFEK